MEKDSEQILSEGLELASNVVDECLFKNFPVAAREMIKEMLANNSFLDVCFNGEARLTGNTDNDKAIALLKGLQTGFYPLPAYGGMSFFTHILVKGFKESRKPGTHSASTEYIKTYAILATRYGEVISSFLWFLFITIADRKGLLNWDGQLASEVKQAAQIDDIVQSINVSLIDKDNSNKTAILILKTLEQVSAAFTKMYPIGDVWDENFVDNYEGWKDFDTYETHFDFEKQPHLSRLWTEIRALNFTANATPPLLIFGDKDNSFDQHSQHQAQIDYCHLPVSAKDKMEIADELVGTEPTMLNYLQTNPGGDVEEGKDYGVSALKDAYANREWAIPWGATIEIDFHPFSALRLFELPNRKVIAVWLTSSGKSLVLHSLLENDGVLANNQFAFTPANDIYTYAIDADENGDAELKGLYGGYGQTMAELSIITAAWVRDFWVCQHRHTTLGAPRLGRLKGKLGNLMGDIVIYLPRVKYHRAGLVATSTSMFEYGNRVSHMVMAANRKLPEGHKASTLQIEIARAQNRSVPPGYTFVRSHERGATQELERRRIYRSRSAAIELAKIHSKNFGNAISAKMSPLEFEEACAQFMQKQGLTITHHNVSICKDKGVDIHSFKEIDGSAYRILGQCKRYQSSVGAPQIREFYGAYALQKKLGSEVNEAWMFALYGFSKDAVEDAAILGIRLITGIEIERGLLH